MLNIFIDTFKGLSTLLWISQIMGIIGFLVLLVSYQFGKIKFFFISSIAFVFFVLEQVIAGFENPEIISNAIVSFIGLIRNILMLIFVLKYNKQMPKKILNSIVIIIWVVEFIFFAITKSFNVWQNYLPPLIVSVFTFMQNSKNTYVVKAGCLINEAGFLVYYLIYGLPFSILRQAILVGSIVISVLILLNKERKYKNESNKVLVPKEA